MAGHRRRQDERSFATTSGPAGVAARWRTVVSLFTESNLSSVGDRVCATASEQSNHCGFPRTRYLSLGVDARKVFRQRIGQRVKV